MLERPTYSIIGQSNSILKGGYAKALEDSDAANLYKNASLGASPSLIGCVFGSDDLFIKSQICIFEFCVFDQVLFWSGQLNYYREMKLIEALIHAARSKGCQPLFLLLPHEAVVGSHLGIYGLMKSTAIENRCYFFDVERWIRDDSLKNARTVKSYYSDSNHMTPETSKKIAGMLNFFFAKFQTDNLVEMSTFSSQYDYENVSLTTNDAEGLNIIKRKNSLMEQNFLRMIPDDEIAIYIGKNSYVHGILINASQSFSAVEISGTGSIIKDLCTAQASPEISFRAQLIPICGVVADREGFVTLKLLNYSAVATEQTYQSKVRQSNFPEQVEIASLIVEHRNTIKSYTERVPLGSEIDILSKTYAY